MTWKPEYNQKRQAYLTEKQRQRRQKTQQQITANSKAKLSHYYKASNIQILMSLKDYLESSPAAQRLWTRFCEVVLLIQSEVSDIIEIMRLREVSEDLIQAYWVTAKQKSRQTKSWTKLTFAQQQAKKAQWAKELKQEERELLAKLSQEETKQKAKMKAEQAQKQAEITAYWAEKNPSKLQCSDCQKWVKNLDEENNLCSPCLKNYE